MEPETSGPPHGPAEHAGRPGIDAPGDMFLEEPPPAVAGELDIARELIDTDLQQRLWLKAVVPLLQQRPTEADASARVQYALDMMYIAACERVARILHSDLPPPA